MPYKYDLDREIHIEIFLSLYTYDMVRDITTDPVESNRKKSNQIKLHCTHM